MGRPRKVPIQEMTNIEETKTTDEEKVKVTDERVDNTDEAKVVEDEAKEETVQELVKKRRGRKPRVKKELLEDVEPVKKAETDEVLKRGLRHSIKLFNPYDSSDETMPPAAGKKTRGSKKDILEQETETKELQEPASEVIKPNETKQPVDCKVMKVHMQLNSNQEVVIEESKPSKSSIEVKESSDDHTTESLQTEEQLKKDKSFPVENIVVSKSSTFASQISDDTKLDRPQVENSVQVEGKPSPEATGPQEEPALEGQDIKDDNDDDILKENCDRCRGDILIPDESRALESIVEHCQNCPEKSNKDVFLCYKCSFFVPAKFSNDFRTHITRYHLKKKEESADKKMQTKSKNDADEDKLPQSEAEMKEKIGKGKTQTDDMVTHPVPEGNSSNIDATGVKSVQVVISESDEAMAHYAMKAEKSSAQEEDTREVCIRCDQVIVIADECQALESIVEHCKNCPKKSKEDEFPCYKCSLNSKYINDFRTHITRSHLIKKEENVKKETQEIVPKEKAKERRSLSGEPPPRRKILGTLGEKLPLGNIPPTQRIEARKQASSVPLRRPDIGQPDMEARTSGTGRARTGPGNAQNLQPTLSSTNTKVDWCAYCKVPIHMPDPDKAMVAVISHCMKPPHDKIQCFVCNKPHRSNGDLIAHITREHKRTHAKLVSPARAAPAARNSPSNSSSSSIQGQTAPARKCCHCNYEAISDSELAIHMLRHKVEC
uniref:C2H2-type domain-containing protein n=1 Tax=Cacopsylla melanoneura TaxID=428564 RepID=A0A8D8XV61_9HEMI